MFAFKVSSSVNITTAFSPVMARISIAGSNAAAGIAIHQHQESVPLILDALTSFDPNSSPLANR